MHGGVWFGRGEIDGLKTCDWRSGRKDNRARICLRLPIDNRLQGSSLRIDREIATPTTDAQDASGHGGPLSFEWRGHSLVDSRCFDATIPKRGPVPSGIRHSRILMPSANARGLGAFQSSGREHWVNRTSFNQKVSRGKLRGRVKIRQWQYPAGVRACCRPKAADSHARSSIARAPDGCRGCGAHGLDRTKDQGKTGRTRPLANPHCRHGRPRGACRV